MRQSDGQDGEILVPECDTMTSLNLNTQTQTHLFLYIIVILYCCVGVQTYTVLLFVSCIFSSANLVVWIY